MADRHRLLTALCAVLIAGLGWSPARANGQTKPKVQRLNLAQIIEKAQKNPLLRAARAASDAVEYRTRLCRARVHGRPP